jgi:DNA-binding transcriptional LysR family regulator
LPILLNGALFQVNDIAPFLFHSQPSLTNAIIRLEQELGGPLFERKPAVALTVLGHAVHPYLQRIAENADLARGTSQALVNVRLAVGVVEQLAAMPETPGVDW